MCFLYDLICLNITFSYCSRCPRFSSNPNRLTMTNNAKPTPFVFFSPRQVFLSASVLHFRCSKSFLIVVDIIFELYFMFVMITLVFVFSVFLTIKHAFSTKCYLIVSMSFPVVALSSVCSGFVGFSSYVTRDIDNIELGYRLVH